MITLRTRALLSQERAFHSSLLRYKEEDYEIDLITLKKRPKRKKNLKGMIDIVSSGAKKNDDIDKLKESLFEDAAAFVKNDEIKVYMPPQSKPQILEQDIVNLQRPKKVVKDAIKESNENLVSEKAHSNGQLKDLLKLVSKEVPQLTKEANQLANEIEDNISKMRELRTKIAKVELEEKEAMSKFMAKKDSLIKREDLEKFLSDAKLTKDRDDEEHFREERRFESIQSLNSSRSLLRNNFFDPIDERLIRSVKKSLPRPNQSDELLFPTLPKISSLNMSHEFLVYVNGKQIVTQENPFGPHYLPPDLISIFNQLGDTKPFIKTINKLENQKWRLIGTELMGSTRVLVFERYIDKKQETKQSRLKILKNITWVLLGSFGLLNLVGYMDSQKSKWVIDKDGELVKSK